MSELKIFEMHLKKYYIYYIYFQVFVFLALLILAKYFRINLSDQKNYKAS